MATFDHPAMLKPRSEETEKAIQRDITMLGWASLAAPGRQMSRNLPLPRDIEVIKKTFGLAQDRVMTTSA